MRSKKRKIICDIAAFILTLSVLVAIRYAFNPVMVSGDSMYPTFCNADLCTGTRPASADALSAGDIVVFKEDGALMIKRIVAAPGDDVLIESGMLYVNERLSPYQYEKIEEPGIAKETVHISDDEYFCMGDNRNTSYDSRSYGPVTYSQIICVVNNRLINLSPSKKGANI